MTATERCMIQSLKAWEEITVLKRLPSLEEERTKQTPTRDSLEWRFNVGTSLRRESGYCRWRPKNISESVEKIQQFGCWGSQVKKRLRGRCEVSKTNEGLAMSGELYNQRQRLVGGQQNGSTYSCGAF